MRNFGYNLNVCRKINIYMKRNIVNISNIKQTIHFEESADIPTQLYKLNYLLFAFSDINAKK